MKKLNKKLTCLLAVILTISMLMSVCMVEAFAAVKPETEIAPCASGTLQGYNVSASLSRTSSLSTYTCYAVADVNMGVRTSLGYAYYSTGGSSPVTFSYEFRDSADYYGYNLAIPVFTKESVPISYSFVSAHTAALFQYNGAAIRVPASC